MVDEVAASGDRDDALPASPEALPVRARSVVQQALPIYYALLFGILTVAALWLALRVRHVIMLIFVSLIFAAAVSGPASHLERRGIPRTVAVLIVYLLAVAVILGGAWLVVPPLLRDLAQFARDIPHLVGRVEAVRDRYQPLADQYPGLGSLDRELLEFSQNILAGMGGRLDRLPGALFGFLFVDFFSVIILSLMIVFAREQILGVILSLTAPRYHDVIRRVLREMWVRVGLYLRARGMIAVIVGTLQWLALVLLHAPYPPLLAVIAGVGELIPQFGVWLARVPIVAIAALHGPRTAGLVLASSFLIELIKGHTISPLIEGRQLHVHPMIAVVSGLVGLSLLGVAGGFIALPAAAMIQVLYDEVLVPWRRAQLGLPPVPEPALASPPARPRRWSFFRRER